jgi:hypothetical protein
MGVCVRRLVGTAVVLAMAGAATGASAQGYTYGFQSYLCVDTPAQSRAAITSPPIMPNPGTEEVETVGVPPVAAPEFLSQFRPRGCTGGQQSAPPVSRGALLGSVPQDQWHTPSGSSSEPEKNSRPQGLGTDCTAGSA